MDKQELANRFIHHPPTGTKPERHEAIRGEAYRLALVINEFCDDSREKRLAITKLEEAMFWSNAAIARRE